MSINFDYYMLKETAKLYGKKAKAFLTKRLSGQFALGFKVKNDIDESLEICNLIYKHGGILMRSLKKSGTLIIEDDLSQEALNDIQKRGLKPMTKSELYNITRME